MVYNYSLGEVIPRISIIICTRDRSDSLKMTLESIDAAAIPEGWHVKLLVVDNGSTDSTRNATMSVRWKKISASTIRESRRGKSYAYNTGIAAADGDIFLCTDDDIRVPKNWIEGMCTPILNGRAQAVQGGVKIASHLNRPWLEGPLRMWRGAVENPGQPPETLVGANMAFSRVAFSTTQGFDPRLGPGASGWCEDTMFGWRLRQNGQNIIYLPEVSVEHHFDPKRLTLRSFVNSVRGLARSRAIIAQTINPTISRPSIIDVALEVPGLAVRCVSQALNLIGMQGPDHRFLLRYYRICLLIALRAELRPFERI